MRSVADAVGVKGPSLYKRVPDRAALLRAITESVVADLAWTMSRATESGDPRADLRAAAVAYRAFVLAIRTATDCSSRTSTVPTLMLRRSPLLANRSSTP